MFQLKNALLRAVPVSLVALAAQGALAQAEEHVDLATRWKVDDANPMTSIPSEEDRNKDPLEFGYYLQDMLFRAEGAYKKQDFKNAAKYYEPLSVAVPTVARSFSRLCDSYARLGELARAIESCRTAITLNGAKVIDHLRYVDLLLRKPSFGAADAQDVTASLEHLREYASKHPQPLPGQQPDAAAGAAKPESARDGWTVPGDLADAEEGKKKPLTPEQKAAAIAAEKEAMKKKMRELLEGSVEPEPKPLGGPHLPTQIEFAACRLAVRTHDVGRLPECMARLREYAFPEKGLLPFKWAEALERRDEPRAATLLEEAEQSGVNEEVLASMRVEHEKVFGTTWLARLKKQWAPLLGLAVLLLSGALFFGKRRGARPALAPTTSA